MEIVVNERSSEPAASAAFNSEFLFTVPIFGYALAYAYEAGAYFEAGAPNSFIVVSIPQIFMGCLSVAVPLMGIAYASSKSSQTLMDRGWIGLFFLLLFPMLAFSPIIFVGMWKGEAIALYIGCAGLIGYSAVTLAYVMNRSPMIAGFFQDFTPPARKLLALGTVILLVASCAGFAGAASERSKSTYTVQDHHCKATTRIFRVVGDAIIALPGYRGTGRAFEVISLSNRGAVRMKEVSREEYLAALAMAGPCSKVG